MRMLRRLAKKSFTKSPANAVAGKGGEFWDMLFENNAPATKKAEIKKSKIHFDMQQSEALAQSIALGRGKWHLRWLARNVRDVDQAHLDMILHAAAKCRDRGNGQPYWTMVLATIEGAQILRLRYDGKEKRLPENREGRHYVAKYAADKLRAGGGLIAGREAGNSDFYCVLETIACGDYFGRLQLDIPRLRGFWQAFCEEFKSGAGRRFGRDAIKDNLVTPTYSILGMTGAGGVAGFFMAPAGEAIAYSLLGYSIAGAVCIILMLSGKMLAVERRIKGMAAAAKAIVETAKAAIRERRAKMALDGLEDL